ncbi:uncharacterized protein [Chanodichthys erythropterus]
MAPNPCATRWNSWFTAVQYHSEHFGLYKEFIEKEIDTCGKTTPQSVERLHEMLQDPNMAESLQVQISIMANKCRVLIGLLDIFQSRRPIVTKAFDYLEDLHMKLEANKDLSYETCAEYFEGLDLSFAIKMQILNRVEQAYINAEDKLSKYISDGQPAISFLKEVRVFDPRHIAFMSDSVSSYESIPGFSDVPKNELDAYFTRLGPAAVHAAACGVVDLDIFWDGLKERLPILSGLAIRYKSVIVNSADAERSNSIYKLVLSSRRRSVTNDNLKALVFLYHNQRLASGAFEDKDFEEDFESFDEA